MKLIVGLGNPGREYEKTRHNIGFYMLDQYLGNVTWKEKFNGLFVERKIKDEKAIFLKPCSFMNLSGTVIKKYIDYYKIAVEDLFIIHDDLDLPFGYYKLKSKGSSGGHNGLKDIEKNIGTQDYKRLKIGISNDKNIDTKDYVLGKFSDVEQKKLLELSDIVNNIINDLFCLNFDVLMNKYNHKK